MNHSAASPTHNSSFALLLVALACALSLAAASLEASLLPTGTEPGSLSGAIQPSQDPSGLYQRNVPVDVRFQPVSPRILEEDHSANRP
ncbi:MAG: hypothetical protein JOZ39_10030 [Chloroflexi bacterium]|nr:hypothetical protein [Chloroflexota bacterium]